MFNSLTTCVNTLDVLVRKLASPLYTAVIECEPTVNVLVANVATPLPTLPVPKVVAPSLNVTRPLVAIAVTPLVLTVAVKVTESPLVEGFSEEARVTVEATANGVVTV